MVSTRTLLKKVLNVKDMVVIGVREYRDVFNRQCLDIEARPVARKRNRCPYCEENVPATTERAEDTVFGEVWTLAEQ